MLLPDAASLWACRNFQQPVHHWHPTGSNHRAVFSLLIVNGLRMEKKRLGLYSRTSRGGILRKNVERQFAVHSGRASVIRRELSGLGEEGDPQTIAAGIGRHCSVLAVGAVVGAAAGEDDALDGRFADEAGFSEALIDAMLELEEAADSVRRRRNRRQRNRRAGWRFRGLRAGRGGGARVHFESGVQPVGEAECRRGRDPRRRRCCRCRRGGSG